MSNSELTISGRIKEEGMILPGMHIRRRISALYVFSIALVMVAMITFSSTLFAAVKQKSFGSAEEAVKALVTAARNNDDKELLAIFGPDAKDLIFSGDKVADKERREKVIAAYDEQHKLAPEGNSMILVIGIKDFPFPIPIVREVKPGSSIRRRARRRFLTGGLVRTSLTLSRHASRL